MNRQRRERLSRLALPGALGLTAALVAAAALLVDLRPSIDPSFFFGSGSRALEQQQKIAARFGGQSQVVLIAQAPDITSDAYAERIGTLTEAVAAAPGVLQVKSVTRGPDGVADARESPFWRRLLLAGDGSATHVVAIVRNPWPDALIPRLREIVSAQERADFRVLLAGVPYTVTVMQEKLVRDFTVFGAAAVAVFSLASLALFRSLRVAAGTLASGLAAVAVTLLGVQAIGGGLGLLSANLVTIVFVLTQSHVVFLTSNRLNAADAAADRGMDAADGGAALTWRAWKDTLHASSASMLTTVLGFATLLFVEAKPLQQLGLGGVMGTVVAFGAAYLLYPAFLLRAPARRRASEARPPRASDHRGVAVAVAAACVLLGAGLVRLETDPSLLTYFDPDGVVHRGLEKLDESGGSSPLELVVQRADRAPLLDGDGAYERLWELQRALEQQRNVGRVISLPVVLAEAKQFPLSFLISEGLMLDLLDSPLLGNVAGQFVTADRRQALFLLQMSEQQRETSRLEVVERLREVANDHGFHVLLSGGIYELQGHLSRQVASSMVQSLAALAVLFGAIAWLTAGSLRVGLAMTASLGLAPLAVFGAMGWLGTPLDIVAAPAAAVGLGLAADAILHLTVATRRAGEGSFSESAWSAGLRSQRAGILRATGIVAGGFALFAFSSFPPTRRFGLAVAGATLLAAVIALRVLPAVAAWVARGRRDRS